MPKLILKIIRDTGGLAAVGIIGGSDGPTAVYIAGGNGAAVLPITAASVTVAVFVAAGILVLRHRKRK